MEDVVPALLEYDPARQVMHPDKHHRIPLHWACQSSFDIVEKLLCTMPNEQVTCPDGEGYLPLHYACLYNSVRMIRLLLTYEPERQALHLSRYQQLPLHMIDRGFSRSEGVRLLLAYSAQHQLLAADDNGVGWPIAFRHVWVTPDHGEKRLPLHYACERGYREVVDLLLASGEATQRLWKDEDYHKPIQLAMSDTHIFAALLARFPDEQLSADGVWNGRVHADNTLRKLFLELFQAGVLGMSHVELFTGSIKEQYEEAAFNARRYKSARSALPPEDETKTE